MDIPDGATDLDKIGARSESKHHRHQCHEDVYHPSTQPEPDFKPKEFSKHESARVEFYEFSPAHPLRNVHDQVTQLHQR